MLEIVRRGADVVRINCAHDDADIWGAMIANTGAAAEAVGRRIPVLMDIAGPKFRIGEVKRRLGAGDRLRLVRDASAFSNDLTIEADANRRTSAPSAVGTEVSFDDGSSAA